MCGICGIYKSNSNASTDTPAFVAMMDSIAHRGPDESGTFKDDGITLGHRRLAIIDLESGQQPMTSLSGRYTICFNGEIYNFRELRNRLSAAGATFRTNCDTEVLLNGYEIWGESVLEHTAGMFAFAIWDHVKRSLVLARDRLGVKPLYYTTLENGDFVFCSELKGLMPYSTSDKNKIAPDALACYLSNGYIIGKQSIFKNIFRLPPSSYIKIHHDGKINQHKYWNLSAIWRNASEAPLSVAEAEEGFSELLDTAVRERMISDVPLGAFLSGGLDSSAITALMQNHSPSIDTFNIGFTNKSYDESIYAREVASHLGCNHTEQIVDCAAPELLREIIAHLDEPFADTSIVPTYVLCRETRRRMTVALSGDGGDELLAGYVTHDADSLHSIIRRIPKPILRGLQTLAELVPDSEKKVSFNYKLKQFIRGTDLPPAEAHAWWRMLQLPENALSMLSHEFRPNSFSPFTPFIEAYIETEGLSHLDRFLYVDYATWLADDILYKADRASMAHSLEVRSPFLDHRLIEFCCRVPPELKLNFTNGKRLLKKIMQGILPKRIINRKKSGFNSPVSDWLRNGWRELTEDTLSSRKLNNIGILDGQTVSAILNEHLSGKRDHGYLLFAVLVLALWIEENL